MGVGCGVLFSLLVVLLVVFLVVMVRCDLVIVCG